MTMEKKNAVLMVLLNCFNRFTEIYCLPVHQTTVPVADAWLFKLKIYYYRFTNLHTGTGAYI